ncbi:MAG TPA: DUF1684 domain-containing protein [Patescibacteria group bacterium]|nr:DUF1684 domain-containing protein [Patescibacteria group bacterium]
MSTNTLMGKSRTLMIVALLLCIVFAGLPLLAEAARNGDDLWRQELLKEREQKDIEFKTSATSPMAGSARLTVSALGKSFIMILDGTVSAQPQAGAGTVFAVFSREGKWYWNDAAPDVTCRMGERAMARNVEALEPGCLFKAGRFTLAAYPGPESLALIVFDPQRRQQLDFEHLSYFPPDPVYAVKARLEKFPEKREVKVTTTRKLEKTFYRYARIHFQIAGRELVLTALKSSLQGPDSDYLFIPFKDATNGEETYEVGRFMDVPEPQGEEFILDFNRCYNPLCNYSPAYNCPLPPLENFLDIAVPAGEKTYPH